MADLITGIFFDRSSAERAVDKVAGLGYDRDDISVIMDDRTRAKEFAESTGTTAGSAHKTADAAKSAAKVGGTLAAILAGAAAVGAMLQDKTDDRTTTSTPAHGSAGSTSGHGSAGSTSGHGSATAAPAGRETTAPGAAVGSIFAPSPYSSSPSYAGSPTMSVRQTAVDATRRETTSETTSDTSTNGTAFVAGPLAAVLLPAFGAGLMSAFSKAGIPKEHAERYAQGLEIGGIVVGVQARSGDEARVRQALTA